jgi:hypothetical protein
MTLAMPIYQTTNTPRRGVLRYSRAGIAAAAGCFLIFVVVTMARARNIKPGLYKNDELAECSIWARFIFPGLWMLADREGRLEDRPKKIKAELLPFDGADADELLQELADHKFILRYTNEDGAFIQIRTFKAHQNPHYSEKPSVIKPPSLPEFQSIDGEGFQESPGALQGEPCLNEGVKPADSLFIDSLIPDSPNPDPLHSRSKERKTSGILRWFRGMVRGLPPQGGKGGCGESLRPRLDASRRRHAFVGHSAFCSIACWKRREVHPSPGELVERRALQR